jgi:hypothetical protein
MTDNWGKNFCLKTGALLHTNTGGRAHRKQRYNFKPPQLAVIRACLDLSVEDPAVAGGVPDVEALERWGAGGPGEPEEFGEAVGRDNTGNITIRVNRISAQSLLFSRFPRLIDKMFSNQQSVFTPGMEGWVINP